MTNSNAASKKRKASSDLKGFAVTLRLPPETAERLKHYEEHLRNLRPNLRITRAGLVRAVIERGLVTFELEEKEHESRGSEAKPLVRW